MSDFFATRGLRKQLILKAIFCFLSLLANRSYAAAENIPAARMTDLFFSQCVSPLLEEKMVVGNGLVSVSKDKALSLNSASTGRAWRAQDARVYLVEMRSAKGKFYGCSVKWHPADRAVVMDYAQVIKSFDEWADANISQGIMAQNKQCGDRQVKYMRVVESQAERRLPIRVVLSYDRDIDFVFLMAGETDVMGGEELCPSSFL